METESSLDDGETCLRLCGRCDNRSCVIGLERPLHTAEEVLIVRGTYVLWAKHVWINVQLQEAE
jgi:hypothetical protein